VRDHIVVKKIGCAYSDGHEENYKFESDQIKSLLMSKEKSIINEDNNPEDNMSQYPDLRVF
jgi:hypothetical protein